MSKKKKQTEPLPAPPAIAACDWYEMVKKMQELYEHPIGETIAPMLAERRRVRASWMMEETLEFATSDGLIPQVDALLDLLVFTLGNLVEMGVDPRELFDIVHQSNMGKIWPDGTIHWNEKGKAIKPATWEAPEPQLAEVLVNRMHEESEEIPF